MHLEREWLISELVKLVVRYIQRKNLSPDNSSKEWLDLVQALIGGSMQAYTSACGNKSLFHDLDLVPSFAAVVWALLSMQPGKSVRDLLRWLDVKDVVVDVFEGKLDDTALNGMTSASSGHNFFGWHPMVVSSGRTAMVFFLKLLFWGREKHNNCTLRSRYHACI